MTSCTVFISPPVSVTLPYSEGKPLLSLTVPPHYYCSNQSIPVTVVVNNTTGQNVTLKDVAINGQTVSLDGFSNGPKKIKTVTLKPGDTVTCATTMTTPPTPTPPGTSFVLNAVLNYQVGSLSTTATASATTTYAPITLTVAPEPPTTSNVNVFGTGDAVYTFRYTNTSPYNLTVTSRNASTNSCGTTLDTVNSAPGAPLELAPGDSAVCGVTHVVTAADLTCGRFNTTLTIAAKVTGSTSPDCSTVTSSSSVASTYVETLSLVKTMTATTVSLTDLTIVPSGTPLVPGNAFHYNLQVTNVSNVPNPSNGVKITGIVITDPNLGKRTFTAFSSSPFSLDPGQTMGPFLMGSYALTQGDIDSGTYSSSVTATGTTVGGAAIAATKPITTTITPYPSVELTKSTDSIFTSQGQPIVYTYTVKNTGNVTLKNVAVVDDKITGTNKVKYVSSTCSPSGSTLSPGCTNTYTSTYISTQQDIATGITNNTHVEGSYGTGCTRAGGGKTLHPYPNDSKSTTTPSQGREYFQDEEGKLYYRDAHENYIPVEVEQKSKSAIYTVIRALTSLPRPKSRAFASIPTPIPTPIPTAARQNGRTNTVDILRKAGFPLYPHIQQDKPVRACSSCPYR